MAAWSYVASRHQPSSSVVVPSPLPLPDNFSLLTPEEKQNIVLASAMNLKARLLSSGLALDPQDTKAIAQLASVAQGIVRTSVELEQLRADRNKMHRDREEKIRVLINKIPERPRVEPGHPLSMSVTLSVKRSDGTDDIRVLLTPRRPED